VVATLVSQLVARGPPWPPFFSWGDAQGDTMNFKLSYDNGQNSFSYEFSGTNVPSENIVDALRSAIDTLFPEALFVIPDDIEPDELDEREETRNQLYDEVDKIIDHMYGYYEEGHE
jgi:hypothetical protein